MLGGVGGHLSVGENTLWTCRNHSGSKTTMLEGGRVQRAEASSVLAPRFTSLPEKRIQKKEKKDNGSPFPRTMTTKTTASKRSGILSSGTGGGGDINWLRCGVIDVDTTKMDNVLFEQGLFSFLFTDVSFWAGWMLFF